MKCTKAFFDIAFINVELHWTWRQRVRVPNCEELKFCKAVPRHCNVPQYHMPWCAEKQVANLRLIRREDKCYTAHVVIPHWQILGQTISPILDFQLSLCSVCCMFSSGQFPGVWILYADVSEHFICSISIGKKVMWHLLAYEDGTDRMLIIIFINCSWVVTRWQWLFYIVKRQHIKFRRRGITQKKTYNISVPSSMV
jgi:hypothetical protein